MQSLSTRAEMATIDNGVSVLVRSSVTELRRRSDSVTSELQASKAAKQDQHGSSSAVPEVANKSMASMSTQSMEFEESLMAEGKGVSQWVATAHHVPHVCAHALACPPSPGA